MNCYLCNKPPESFLDCPLCSKLFCSYNCLSAHLTQNHNYMNPDEVSKQSFRCSVLPKSHIYSPYITPGYMLSDIKYDSKYELKNFLFKNGEQKVIGEGSLSIVYLAFNVIDKKFYAIKKMKKSFLNTTSYYADVGLFREIDYQSRICHQNIIKLLNAVETENNFYLVLEYGDKGTLFNYIRKRGHLTESEAFPYFIQVVNAIHFLHQYGFLHRDLKPENILLFSNGLCKICDFGWSCNLGKNRVPRKTYCGTIEYMSPEIVMNKKYSKEIDIWSLGVLLYEMLHGYSPFNSPLNSNRGTAILENIKNCNLSIARNISPACKELLLQLLDPDPMKRIKINEIFNSNFVKYYERKGVGLPKNFVFRSEVRTNNDISDKKINKSSNANIIKKTYYVNKNSNTISITPNNEGKTKLIYKKKIINRLEDSDSINNYNKLNKSSAKKQSRLLTPDNIPSNTLLKNISNQKKCLKISLVNNNNKNNNNNNTINNTNSKNLYDSNSQIIPLKKNNLNNTVIIDTRKNKNQHQMKLNSMRIYHENKKEKENISNNISKDISTDIHTEIISDITKDNNYDNNKNINEEIPLKIANNNINKVTRVIKITKRIPRCNKAANCNSIKRYHNNLNFSITTNSSMIDNDNKKIKSKSIDRITKENTYEVKCKSMRPTSTFLKKYKTIEQLNKNYEGGYYENSCLKSYKTINDFLDHDYDYEYDSSIIPSYLNPSNMVKKYVYPINQPIKLNYGSFENLNNFYCNGRNYQ